MDNDWIKKEKPEEVSIEPETDGQATSLPLGWLDEFPWLVYFGGNEATICSLCQNAGHPEVLPNVSYHELLAHAWSVVHKEAEIKQSQRNLDQKTGDAEDKKRQTMMEVGDRDVSSTQTTSQECADSAKPSADKRRRRFCRHWLATFPWLKYDSDNNLMFCKYCIKHRTGNSSFVRGNSSFKMTTIQAHAHCKEHYLAERAESLSRPQKGVMASPGVAEHRLTPKKTYLLKKFLRFFPWLLYNSEMNVVICDVCQRHTVNTLYVECTTELDYDVIRAHCDSRKHQQAEEAEVKSWVTIFEAADAKGVPVEDEPLQIIKLPEPATENGVPDGCKTSPPSTPDGEKDATLTSRDSETMSSGKVCGVNEEEEEDGESYSGSQVDAMHPFLEEQANMDGFPEGPSGKRYKSKKGHILPAFGIFKAQWMQEFPWLCYEIERNLMRCMLCAKYSKNTTFARGVRVFSRSYIMHHTKIAKHKDAARQEIMNVPGGGLAGSSWTEDITDTSCGKGRKKLAEGGTEHGDGRGSGKRKEADTTWVASLPHKRTHPTMRHILSPEERELQSDSMASSSEDQQREKSDRLGSPMKSPSSPSGLQIFSSLPQAEFPIRPHGESQVTSGSTNYPTPESVRGSKNELNKDLTPKFYRERGLSSGSSDDTCSGDSTQVDQDTEAKNTPQDSPEDGDAVSGKGYQKIRRFCSHWLVIFPWLDYDENQKIMLCKMCCRYHLNNTFTRGSRSFHIDTLRKHEGSIVHQSASKLRAGSGAQIGGLPYGSAGVAELQYTPTMLPQTPDNRACIPGDMGAEPVYPTTEYVSDPYGQRTQGAPEQNPYSNLAALADMTYGNQAGRVGYTQVDQDVPTMPTLTAIKQEKTDYN